MKSKLSTFAMGAIFGGITAFLVIRSPEAQIVRQRDQLQAELTTASSEISTLAEQLTNSVRKGKQMEDENIQLAKRVQELSEAQNPIEKKAASTDSQPAPTNTTTPQPTASDAAMKFMGQANLEMQVEGQLLQLKKHLKLTPTQEIAAREILTRQFDLAKRTGNPKADLQALFTAEQQTAFQELQQEQRQLRASLSSWQSAISELSQLQFTFGLSQEQMEQAWPALYDYARAQVQDSFTGNSKQRDPARLQALEDLTKRRLESLKSVLPDEQFAIYQKHQQQFLQGIQMLEKASEKP